VSNKVEQLVERISSHSYGCSPVSGNGFRDLEFVASIRGRDYNLKPIRQARDVIIFGGGLSEWSKDMFCPYAWDDVTKAEPALRELIQNHMNGRDIAYLLFEEDSPVGFFFLWGMTRKDSGLYVPELGEGIVDSHQGRGLGGFALDMLTEIADVSEADAVELTTDLRNEVAKKLYESRGYELLGTIVNPLEIDQTKPLEELKKARKFREEYHMARIFKNRKNVLDYLTKKRERQNQLK